MRVKKPRLPKRHDCIFNTPIGRLGVTVDACRIVAVDFLSARSPLKRPATKAVSWIVADIKRYFLGLQTEFHLTTSLDGTPLQQKIWRFLQRIPLGKTITYGELAKKIVTSPRVIGNACRLNPLPIIIPCHRVVAKSGLGGYCGKRGGKSSKIKQWLLQHEKSICETL